MDDIVFILTLMTWFFNFTLLIVGGALGVVGGLTVGPAIYRSYRRYTLRRQWRQDTPLRAEPALSPLWVEYDPELTGVGHRCICHRRPVNPGELVLLWPETGPGGILHIAVYCESTKELL